MKRILVTGATGFIGRHVLKPLNERGFEVHIVSRLSRDPSTELTAHRVDLLSPSSLSALIDTVRPTHLLHLAWHRKTGCGFYNAPENYVWARASMELFGAFQRVGGHRAVFAGSCAEYDWAYEIMHETQTPSNPRTDYGHAKNAAREGIQRMATDATLSTAWARIFFTFGPHEPLGRLVSDVASALAGGEVVETTTGQQERDYLYVADVAAALVALVDGDLVGTINIASGESVPVRRIVELLGNFSGRSDLLAIGARDSRSQEPERLVADVTRLRTELGIMPHCRLEEGLETTFAWWQRRIAVRRKGMSCP
jgi:nucleoside-diphosphate-sugar epimerase